MKLASGFCIPEPLPLHSGIKGRRVHPLIRFYAEEPRRVPGNQRWFKIVAWGHNVTPSGNGGYVRNLDVPYLSVTTSYVVMTKGSYG